jgi:adenine-specific DNA-methyltransferase
LLRRSGTAAQRKDSPGGFYAIYVDPTTNAVVKIGEPLPAGVSNPESGPTGCKPILPIRKDGTEGRWQVSPKTLRSYLGEGRVKIGGGATREFTVYYLKPGEWKKVESGEYEASGIGPDGSLLLSGNETSEERVLAIRLSPQHSGRFLRTMLLSTGAAY